MSKKPIHPTLHTDHGVLHGGISYNDKGEISKEFEARRDGPLAVSTGEIGNKGQLDPGGISYGSYQFTSQYIDDKGKHEGTVQKFLRSDECKPFRNHFKDDKGHDLKVNSPEFQKAWQSVKDVGGFEAAQYQYTVNNFYVPQEHRLETIGINLENRSETLRHAVFSAAVQHGPGHHVITDGLEHKAKALHKPIAKLTDAEAIDGIYDERIKVNNNTPGRYPQERAYAQNMLRTEQTCGDREPVPGAEKLAPVPPHLSSELTRQAAQANAVGSVVGAALSNLVPVPLDVAQPVTGAATGDTDQDAATGQTGRDTINGHPSGHRQKLKKGSQPATGRSVADWHTGMTPR